MTSTPPPSHRTVGLTGGIGSGKSRVGQYWRSRGVPVIDADSLARDVVAPGSGGLEQLIARFGEEIVKGGQLDRARLATRCFGHPEELRALNAIVHPLVRAAHRRRLEELERRGEPLSIYEVPLLYETGLERELDAVVVVSAPTPVARARAIARGGLSPEDIDRRLEAQLPLEAKVARADFVVDNGLDWEATEANADRVLADVCARFGIDPRRYPKTERALTGGP